MSDNERLEDERGAIDAYEESERNLEQRDCIDKGWQKYQQDHPCEYCVSKVKLPDYKPQLSSTREDAFKEHREILKLHLTQCRQQVQMENELERIPPKLDCLCLLILRLGAVEGYTDKEIGAILGTTENAVGANLTRCRQKLRPYFQDC